MNEPEVEPIGYDGMGAPLYAHQILAEIEELKENRLDARKDARSGNPAKRAQGQRAVEGVTELIQSRRQLLSKEDES